VEKEWVNISRENGCGMSRALRALVGAGLGGLASPLMMEEECFILNKVRVRKGEEKKGRRMEEGGGERERWPLEFQGSQGKAEPSTIFPGCEKASQLASPQPGQEGESEAVPKS